MRPVTRPLDPIGVALQRSQARAARSKLSAMFFVRRAHRRKYSPSAGADLRKERGSDLVERGAIYVQVPDFARLDRTVRSRSARSERRTSARSSPRFIPARAGNGVTHRQVILAGTVHPRARGERLVDLVAVELCHGSSPRARGTDPLSTTTTPSDRFIPARAGNGEPRGRGIENRAVHPRARGERRRVSALAPLLRRFIPARAGNGSRFASPALLATVHPRARGERVSANASCRPSAGSSPRARGTGLVGVQLDAVDRFIPARAGNGSSLWKPRNP